MPFGLQDEVLASSQGFGASDEVLVPSAGGPSAVQSLNKTSPLNPKGLTQEQLDAEISRVFAPGSEKSPSYLQYMAQPDNVNNPLNYPGMLVRGVGKGLSKILGTPEGAPMLPDLSQLNPVQDAAPGAVQDWLKYQGKTIDTIKGFMPDAVRQATGGVTSSAARQLSELSTPENVALAGLTAGAGVAGEGAAHAVSKAIISYFLPKIVGEQIPQTLGDISGRGNQPVEEPVRTAFKDITDVVGPVVFSEMMRRGLGDKPVQGSGLTRQDLIQPRSIADLPIPKSEAPVRHPLDLSGQPLLLPQFAGETVPRQTRFVAPSDHPPVDLSQLSPMEQAELRRSVFKYTPRETRPMQQPPVILGQQPDVAQQVLTPEMVNPMTRTEPASLVVPELASKPILNPEGGKISFSSPAEAKAIPNALQSAVEPKIQTYHSGAPINPEDLSAAWEGAKEVARSLGLEAKVFPVSVPGQGEHWQFTDKDGRTFYTKAGANPVEVQDAYGKKLDAFKQGEGEQNARSNVKDQSKVPVQEGQEGEGKVFQGASGQDEQGAAQGNGVQVQGVSEGQGSGRDVDYTKLSPEQKQEYGKLNSRLFETRERQWKNPSDEANNKLIDAELAMRKFEKSVNSPTQHYFSGPGLLPEDSAKVLEMAKKLAGDAKDLSPFLDEARRVVGVANREKELRGDTFALSGPRIAMSESGFKNIGQKVDAKQLSGRIQNVLKQRAPAEQKIYEDAGVWKQIEGMGKVSPEEVARVMQEAGPQTKVETYGMEGKVSEARREYDKMTHEWNEQQPIAIRQYIKDAIDGTRTIDELENYIKNHPSKGTMYTNRATPEWLAEARKYVELGRKAVMEKHTGAGPRATSAYSDKGSRVAALSSEEPMPEWTTSKSGKNVQRVDVVIPEKINKDWTLKNGAWVNEKTGEVRTGRQYNQDQQITKPLWQPDKLHENLPNTLGWAMIQYKTGPKGEKIAVIAEAQSRWGQEHRKQLDQIKVENKPATFGDETKPWAVSHQNRTGFGGSGERATSRFATEQEAQQYANTLRQKMSDATGHPLLRDYNRLILKAAIEQARKEGATRIVVSDAETAMMTEGHDVRAANPATIKYEELSNGKIKATDDATGETKIFDSYEAADEWKPRISQEPGMRLNYDTILPKIAEELTGSKGERVSLGEHKNTFSDIQTRYDEAGDTIPGQREPRSNLIFRNPNGTPKTDVSGLMYKLPSRDQAASLFEKDKKTPEGKSQIQYRFSGAGPLPEDVSKLKDTLDKAYKDAREGASGLVDKVFNYGVKQSGDERGRTFLAKQQGWSVPRHVTVAEETGNKLVRFASASEAAPELADALASEVLGKKGNDVEFGEKLGKTLIENRLRALQDSHLKKGEIELADKVTHVLSDADYRKNMSDPEIKAALDQHKAPGGVQETAEKQHAALGGTMAAKGENQLFANLTAITKGKNFEQARDWVYGKGNVNTQSILRGSTFEHKALGVAEDYVSNYRDIAKRMITGNYKRNALRDWLDQGVKDGVYQWAKRGEDAPVMRGQPMVRFPVEVKATPWGSKAVKDVWVRKDLAPEFEQALNGGGKVAKAGAQLLLDAATELQLVGPTDFVFHTGNMLGSIMGSLGAKSFTRDLVRKVAGVKQLDTINRVGYQLYRTIVNSPEVQKELASLAQIGAMRPRASHSSLLGKATGGVLDTGKWIRTLDRAGRLARNDMFDNLVERGLVEDNELNRREFVNKMGQYNAKLMSRFQDTMQKYTSQFVVAGRTFNRNAFQRLLMSNEVRASNPEAYWKMKFLNMAGVTSTLLAVPVLVNLSLTGKPFGRDGTKLGYIDTGKDTKDGRPIVIDPAQSELLRRGLRATGAEAAFSGAQNGDSLGKTAASMAGAIIKGQIHPWAGPPLKIAQTYIEKQAETHNPVEALKAATLAVNPSVAAYFEKDESGNKAGVKGVFTSLGAVLGVKKGAPLTHQQRVEATAKTYGLNMQNYGQRLDAEEKYRAARPAMTREDETRAAQSAIRRNADRGIALQKSLPSEMQSWLDKNSLKLPAHSDRISDAGQTLTLTKEELPRFEELLKKEYLSEIKGLQGAWFDSMEQREKEKMFKETLAHAAKEARMDMSDELYSKGKKKK